MCTVFFAVDYTLHVYTARNRLRYLVTPVSIVDFVTIVPIFFALLFFNQNEVLPVLRIARIVRILAVLRIYRVLVSRQGFEYQLGVLIIFLSSLILVAAGVFQVLEESYYTDHDQSPLAFHQAMYFIFVTISTVGYGDISPHTTGGQFFVMFILIAAITVIPKQVAHLKKLAAEKQEKQGYTHSYSLRRRSIDNGGHVVVTGHVRLNNAAAFLREFYRPRQGRVNMDVVFLVDHMPDPGFRELLLNVRYRRRTKYLKGNLLHDKDAKRAHVAEAAAVFILSNKCDSREGEATDAVSILHALVIDKLRCRVSLECEYLEQRRSKKDRKDGENNEVDTSNHLRTRPIRCFAEMLSFKQTRGMRTITGLELALNTAQLRTAILARNIVCPGVVALLQNLIYSPTERCVTQGRRSSTLWVAEYAAGLQNLLFPAVLPAYFDGLLFEHAVKKLYLYSNVMMIAVYDRSAVFRGKARIRLCPFGDRCEESDLVFLIAPSSSAAKHAVDSLEERDREVENEQFGLVDVTNTLCCPFPGATCAITTTMAVPRDEVVDERPGPALVFSVGTVLDRQSVRLINQRSMLYRDDKADEFASSLPLNSTRSAERTADHTPDEAASSERATASHHNGSSASASSSSLLPPAMGRELSSDSFSQTNTSMSDTERRDLRHHILICGPAAQGLRLAWYLDEVLAQDMLPVSPSSTTGERPAIVLLSKDKPSDEELAAISQKVSVELFIERGEYHNVEDLLRVRVHEAASVLLLPTNWKEDDLHVDIPKNLDKYLDDYHVIMSTRALHTIQEFQQEHIQLHHQSNDNIYCSSSVGAAFRAGPQPCSVVKSLDSIKYFTYKCSEYDVPLNDTQGSESDDEDSIAGMSDTPRYEYQNQRTQYRWNPFALANQRLSPSENSSSPLFTPAYAAGEVLVDSVLDTLLCQSFFNPYIVDVIRALLGDDGLPEGDQTAFKASMMRYFSTASEPSGDDLGRAKKSSSSGGQFPVLRIASISHETEGSSFSDVFSTALSHQILVLGIYRRAQAGTRGNQLPYVVTCPESPTTCFVERGDQLYVLTKRPAPVCI
ncbi:hypothetical protein PHYBOEH_009353 [Phytophthora boehmeriae]|uniref:Voltage-gated Ion Channel (VIC) Superfamily n=1 Tax=Phytophthora boehmeriae TaxID=109152 RepID=A0A8T1VWM1_9STRA|nr:hypothetical protein PHYBOEH_009353 [Phytophthora boehmeriae]